MLGDTDLYLFNEGTHSRLYRVLGAHLGGAAKGCGFAVWAPSGKAVSVIGDFNDWNPSANPLRPVASSGIWTGVVESAGASDRYKYRIVAADGRTIDKADPFGFLHEEPPRTAS